ncbi:Ylf2 protein [Saccharomycopsis crataegensis]|uniref:Obg-like ATPase homolog n=1 Tax=Saccharomycopsis crataegensis TaxID=43959 RepID=A0AAV5QR56_9ASCO|nr:Ylf2 protein [Saccharomycopsis crataegensis]
MMVPTNTFFTMRSVLIFKRSLGSTRYLQAKKKSGSKRGKEEVIIQKYFGRPSSHLSAGIVGLANVGKSTFFQAVTKSEAGIAANYPFATIEPQELLINIPSCRLDFLQSLYQSKKQIKGTLSICDIAGLTKNASKGVGLGNQFLNDIRQVDGIFQVVRGFRDDEITHIEESVDPVRDLEIVSEELVFKDLDFVGVAIESLEKKIKYNKNPMELRVMKSELDALKKAEDILLEGKKISSVKTWTNDDIDGLNRHNLLTAKPTTYLLNVNEEDYLNQQNEFLQPVKNWIDENSPDDNLLIFSAAVETKIKNGEDTLQSAIPQILQEMKNNLNLISFFTCGPLEVREWPVRKNSMAPQAAGIIHTDLQSTFISADVISYSDLDQQTPDTFSLAKLKSGGKIRKEGKSYVIEDGDVMLVKAGAGKAR